MMRLVPPRGVTVLLVDDDANFRAILADVLDAEGCRVAHAEHGLHALTVLESLVPDLIVLDLAMPVMDGFQLLRALRDDRTFAQIPVAILSGTMPEGAWPGVANDVRPFAYVRTLRKPVDLPNLLGLLDAIDDAFVVKVAG